jgi:3-oxoacyl-[acyl-carrier protein] reductase
MKKFACVFGASGEIGQAICLDMANSGWSLYLHFHKNTEAVLQLQQKLAATYQDQDFLLIQADLSTSQGAQQAIDSIFTIEALVFANGQSLYKLLEDTTQTEMDQLWKTHVQSPMTIISALASKMRNHQVTYIVLIGSIWGQTGASGEVVYSAVKGAQHAFVKAYAKEAGASGVRANIISPGFIESPMNASITSEELSDLIEEIPLQRVGNAEEVANMVSFLTSGKADYVTGQVIAVNGGWYI